MEWSRVHDESGQNIFGFRYEIFENKKSEIGPFKK